MYNSAKTTILNQKKSKKTRVADSEAENSDNESSVDENEHLEELPSENIKECYRIYTPNDDEVFRLPKTIKIKDARPGDVTCFRRRRIKNAIRFHKGKEKDSHESLYSEILLYHAFQNEMVDLKEVREDPDKCKDLFLYPATTSSVSENSNDIKNSNIIIVRGKVMPFLIDVEEAREQVISMQNEKIVEGLDAENVQDNDDCNQLAPEIHPDYKTQHPDYFMEGSKQPSKATTSNYKKSPCLIKRILRNKWGSWIPIKDMWLM